MDAALRVAIAVLEGRGPKYSTVVANPPEITGESALSGWIQSGWTTASADAAPRPARHPLAAEQRDERLLHPTYCYVPFWVVNLGV
jgi:hypothetical protein